MFVPDPASALWRHESVQCVIVPDGDAVQVELRNAAGAAFLRKFAPTVQAALNEAEFLRLLLRGDERRVRAGGLKPFAIVVEENRYDADVVIDALKVSGMRAFPCRSGAEAVCMAREVTPDLIVLTYELPDMNGVEVCRHLREDASTASIPIIVLSTDVEAVRSESCTADAVLTKPCPAETLSAAARLFIRHLTVPEDADC